jgi:hypothetical protein
LIAPATTAAASASKSAMVEEAGNFWGQTLLRGVQLNSV